MTARQVWLAARTPLTLLALLAFVAAAGWWSMHAVQQPIPKRPPTPCATTSVGSVLKPNNVYLRLYNATDISGLAKNTKLIFGAAGFKVYQAINAEEPAAKSSIAGSSADSPAVKLVRSYFPADVPFTADAEAYRDGMVTVTLGADFKRDWLLKAKPLPSVPLANGSACLPVFPTAKS